MFLYVTALEAYWCTEASAALLLSFLLVFAHIYSVWKVSPQLPFDEGILFARLLAGFIILIFWDGCLCLRFE